MIQQQVPENTQDSTGSGHAPRLRLKPKAPHSGYVDGAWWPHTDDPTAELPALLAVLSIRLGHIVRVLYKMDAWAYAPRKFVTGGHPVRLDGYRLQPTDTIEVLGLDGGRISLLVIPPDASPDDAHAAMMTAAQPHDDTTVERLLRTTARERNWRAPTISAQERWESEGGTTVSSGLTPAYG